MGFCGNAVEVWIIDAAFGVCRGGFSMIEHVKGGINARRGVHKALIVTREGQRRTEKHETLKGKEKRVKYVTVV